MVALSKYPANNIITVPEPALHTLGWPALCEFTAVPIPSAWDMVSVSREARGASQVFPTHITVKPHLHDPTLGWQLL